MIIPLKMAALCLNANLQMLWPHCYRGKHHLQENLCRCFHEGFLQTVQVVVMLSASHILQNSPQFIVQGVEVWTHWGPILSDDKCRNVPPQPLLSHLSLVGRSWVLLEDPFLTIEERCVNTTPCSTSSWYIWAPVFTPFSQKWRGVTSWWDIPHQTMT